MQRRIFTIQRSQLEHIRKKLPERIRENTGRIGFVTIGAIDNNTRQNVIGLLQFQVGIKRSGESIARLSYVYVHEKHRREGIALSLVNKMNEILLAADIGMCEALIDIEEDISVMDSEVRDIFLPAAGFFLEKEEEEAFKDMDMSVLLRDEYVKDREKAEKIMIKRYERRTVGRENR